MVTFAMLPDMQQGKKKLVKKANSGVSLLWLCFLNKKKKKKRNGMDITEHWFDQQCWVYQSFGMVQR